MSNKEPWLAVNLSLIFPGIGQIYAGNIAKGIFFLVGQFFFFLLGLFLLFLSHDGHTLLGILVLVFTLIFFNIGSLWDAYRSVRNKNDQSFEVSRKSSKDPWRAVFFSRIMLGTGHLYLDKKIIGISLLLFAVLSFFFPLISILTFIAAPFVAFHVYQSAPIRRETNKKAIFVLLFIAAVISPLFSVLMAFTLRNFIAETRYIPSGAMESTLQVNDRLIIDKISYQFNDPKRGDIIVFNPTEALSDRFNNAFIKRIIGLPNETIELKEGQIFLNGQRLDEPYLASDNSTSVEACIYSGFNEPYLDRKQTISADHYLVLGDNRQNSLDGRCWGLVPRSKIIGKASKRFWPLERFGSIYP